MKRMLILVVIVSLLLSFILTGCSENGGTATQLTDEEVVTIAMASLGTTMVSTMFAIPEEGQPQTGDGEYGAGAFDNAIVSGTLTVSGVGTIYTFENCEVDVDDAEAGAEITLNGAFSLGGDMEEGMVLTYDDFNLSGTIPGLATSINIVVTGTLTMTETELTVEITISGITDDPCDVVLVMPMSEGGGTTYSNKRHY